MPLVTMPMVFDETGTSKEVCEENDLSAEKPMTHTTSIAPNFDQALLTRLSMELNHVLRRIGREISFGCVVSKADLYCTK